MASSRRYTVYIFTAEGKEREYLDFALRRREQLLRIVDDRGVTPFSREDLEDLRGTFLRVHPGNAERALRGRYDGDESRRKSTS